MPVPLSQTYGKQQSPPKTNVSLHLEVTRTVGIWPRKVFIQWILRNPRQGSGYFFDVFRSGSADGSWETVATDLEDIYFLIDESFSASNDRSSPDLFSLGRVVYYKVVVTHTTDGTTEQIRKLEAGLDRRRSGIVRKLRRDAMVALRKGSGTEVAILKRRWWGEPCTCRSMVGTTTRAHHEPCNGTGIIYGYWDPVYGFATRSSEPVNVATTEKGNEESHYIRVLMLDIPEVTRYDILVFLRDNKRFMVEEVTNTEIQTVSVHQELKVSELARSSREYALKVDPWHVPEWF
jgi:hypothetical protein